MMNTEELTAYIKNYLENDKTRSAIMLTGAWGSGKSYYIQNVLTKELNKCNHDVAIVSLYGLKTIADLNKSIYLELRAKKTLKKLASKKKNKETKKSNKLFNWIKKHGKEAASGTALVGKTIIKGVAGFFNVPVEFSDKDLEKLYTSINLNGKLIVLEDLERSGIDIIEIMGYVNNLVEQDGVKVLLVANENEIIRYKKDDVEDHDPATQVVKEFVDKDKKPILTEKTKEYIKIKEKTVFDTIKFNIGQSEAVKEIILGFSCKYFKQLLDNNTSNGKKCICDTVVDIMNMLEIFNLRAIIFACQKSENLFNKVAEKIEIDYFETVFCSIIAFALRLSVNSNLVWGNDATSPYDLGVPAFPLHKFVYNFVKNHFFYGQDVLKVQQAFIEQRKLEIKQKEAKNALNTIYYAFEKSESEVAEAVNTICNYLDDINVIPIMEYGKLGNYLIAIKKIISSTTLIDLCKEKILTNIQEAELTDNQKIALEVHDGIELELPEEKVEYEDFSKKIVECVNRQSVRALSTINDANGVKSLIDTISTNHGQFLSNHSLMNGINVGGLLHALPDCTSAQISELRGAIMSFYRAANIAEFLSGDKDALEELQIGLQKIIDDNIIKDKVVLQQIKWFAKNVSNIIYRLKQG